MSLVDRPMHFHICSFTSFFFFFLFYSPFLFADRLQQPQQQLRAHSSTLCNQLTLELLFTTLKQTHYCRLVLLLHTSTHATHATHATHSKQSYLRSEATHHSNQKLKANYKESHCCCQCCLFSVLWFRHRSSSPSSLWLPSPSLSSPQSQSNATIW
jgi:hypothetical protein